MPIENSKDSARKIIISKDGPYLVCGNLPLNKEIIVPDKNGDSSVWQKGEKYPDKETYALCRCGNSSSKPYCDGAHAKIGFNGTETARRKNYIDQAETIEGPRLVLNDAVKFCSRARFCHNKVGDVWTHAEKSGDLKSKEAAVNMACKCSAGRLVAFDKETGKTIEPKFEPSVSLVEDPEKKVSGPVWVKGGVKVESSNGKSYEVRNRVTLCRCGQSNNKPFCDGCHIDAGFNDGDESLRKKQKASKTKG